MENGQKPRFSAKSADFTDTTGLPCIREMSEKNEIFSRSRKNQGILKKMSGNCGHLINVRELSGNFVMTIFFQIELMLG